MKNSTVVSSILVISVALVILPGMVPKRSQVIYESTTPYTHIPSIPEEFLDINDIRERKQNLIDILLPLVLKANEKIVKQREALMSIKKSSYWFSKKEKKFLEKLAKEYKVDKDEHDDMVEDLLVRVNVLPVSLVLAQAAIESGWGTSRFALEGNNIFGIRTESGNGMVPKQQDQGKVFKVSMFKDLQSSIDYYLWNINSHPKYKELRQIRSRSSFPYNSIDLAHGLRHYSEIGYEYVERVIWLIEYNHLQSYDTYRLE
jgi:Bax protein